MLLGTDRDGMLDHKARVDNETYPDLSYLTPSHVLKHARANRSDIYEARFRRVVKANVS